MAIKFGTWTLWRSARPTQRHGSWYCHSDRRPSAPDARFGRCTRSKRLRNRRSSFRPSASPTRPSRSSSLSGWRELAGAPTAAPRGGSGGTAARRGGPRRHGAVRPAPAQGRARERLDPGRLGGARRPGAPAPRGGRGGGPERAGGPPPARSPLRIGARTVTTPAAGGSGGVGAGGGGGGGGEAPPFQDFGFQGLGKGGGPPKGGLAGAAGGGFPGGAQGGSFQG